MNTPTPRTDALAEDVYEKSSARGYIEMEKLARKLEHELFAAHKALMVCDGAMMGKVNPSSVAFKMVNAILRPMNDTADLPATVDSASRKDVNAG